MIEHFVSRANSFRDAARVIFAKYETSAERIITLSSTYAALASLSLKQDELFRQSLRCIENELYRAAHVLSWAGFIDFYEEKISAKKFKKLHAAYPAWSKYKTVDDLRENITEYQLIETRKTSRLLTKKEIKAHEEILNKRNDSERRRHYITGLI